jgi:hypothetical protein
MRLTLELATDFTEVLAGRPVLAGGVGADGQLAVLTGSLTTPPAGVRRLVPRAKPKLGSIASAALLTGMESSRVAELPIEPTSVRHPKVQPLASGGLLIVNPVVSQDFILNVLANAFVFDEAGRLVQQTLFGDAIAHVLVDGFNQAWVGYSDEGVFGNFEWDYGEGPIPLGPSGLVRFDVAAGKPNWSFEADKRDQMIADCYALNVARDATWVYYYTAFDLVRIDLGGAVRRWSTETRGARAVVCGPSRTLLIGRYGEPWEATVWEREATRS